LGADDPCRRWRTRPRRLLGRPDRPRRRVRRPRPHRRPARGRRSHPQRRPARRGRTPPSPRRTAVPARLPARGRGATPVALVVILGLLVACDSDASDDSEGAFYLEAEIVVSSDWSGGRPTEAVRGPTATGLRWWFRDAEHFRHEYYDPSSMLEWGPRWNVADGEDLVFFDPSTALYQRWSLEGSGFSGMYPGFSAVLGPIPGGTVEAFLDDFRSRVERVEHVGTEELLGRSVEVYEYGPTSTSSTESSSGSVVETTSGVGRFYIDEAAGFVLRNV